VPDITDIPEDDALLAGELSLGVLEGDDLTAARRRQLSDPAFASAVEWWDARLARMAEAGGEIEPPAEILAGVHAELDRLQGSAGPSSMAPLEPLNRRPAGWSIGLATLGTAMAAAALVLYVSTPTTTGIVPPTEQVASPQLVAQLQDAEAGRRLASVIDTDARRLAITATGLDAVAGQITELWVIPADGVPRSLGEIPGSGTFERELDAAETALLAEGASLAVTFEQDEGIRHEAPSLPILLVGALDEV